MMNLFSKNALVSMVAVAVWIALTTSAGAAIITGTFSTPTDLGLNDNTGIVLAVDIGNQSASPATVATVGAVPFTKNTLGGPFGVGFESTWAAQGVAANVPSFTDTNLNSILNPFSAAGGGGSSLSGTISGLTVGVKYMLQFLIYDGDISAQAHPPTSAYRGTTTITSSGAATDSYSSFNDMSVLGNPNPIPANKGVYIDYPFIAASTSLTVTFTVDGNGATSPTATSSIVLSAFDLRALPEPTSASLLGISGLLMLRRRRIG